MQLRRAKCIVFCQCYPRVQSVFSSEDRWARRANFSNDVMCSKPRRANVNISRLRAVWANSLGTDTVERRDTSSLIRAAVIKVDLKYKDRINDNCCLRCCESRRLSLQREWTSHQSQFPITVSWTSRFTPLFRLNRYFEHRKCVNLFIYLRRINSFTTAPLCKLASPKIVCRCTAHGVNLFSIHIFVIKCWSSNGFLLHLQIWHNRFATWQ